MAFRLLSCSLRTLSCSMHERSSCPTRDGTRVPCIRSAESYPLDHQGSPRAVSFRKTFTLGTEEILEENLFKAVFLISLTLQIIVTIFFSFSLFKKFYFFC